jgi:hypothetical protein
VIAPAGAADTDMAAKAAMVVIRVFGFMDRDLPGAVLVGQVLITGG